jgi:sulfoxide reductase catalytic subunit YedY
MKTEKFNTIPVKSSEITPESVYLSRRQFMKVAGAALGGAAAAALLAACSPSPTEAPSASTAQTTPGATSIPATLIPVTPLPALAASTDELGNPLNSFDEIANYNNFYEFTTYKEGVIDKAKNFQTSPWQVEVGGLVHNPKTYAVEDLLNKFEQKERVYRLRCVEAWSMVIPWVGFELADLLKEVEPMTSAQFVRFETLLDPAQMPGQKNNSYPWPYTEGLRLDEAMHRLTILGTGLYGKPLPPQDGAPIRLVVPWKYGFKSIKTIIKIDLVDVRPFTLWNTIAPDEYGFYSNVNPEVNHPRWSQKSEHRIGESGRRETLMFNGYAGEVETLYAGMDLKKNY